MKRSLLLIDDDLEEHDIFRIALQNFNADIQFISATSGVYALKLLKVALPDWIFLYINMPGMNGFDTLFEIKKIEPLKEVPVFMFSTSDGFTHSAVALRLGAKKYIRKPNELNDLQRIFSDLLS
jgi:CheY-like chemotaxis protein